ncbi:MAG TPA: peptide chain release factor N(5)-glutamine methyltransferase [Vicinamibacteria bacterium]|nr:peptide chain release factor N(5)-glutamine methyltransferase [Vicinamibacteria bacterium]
MTAPDPSVAALLDAAARRLQAAGVQSAALDAERLLRHVLGWERARVIASAREPVPTDAVVRFEALLAQRASRRPLQHLTGSQAFWRHEFLVTPDVLIPRPETELVVEEALRRLRPLPRPALVDVGTGSGCIALSLAAELDGAEVHATDVSTAALAVAGENARRLGLAGRVAFHEGDLLAPVAEPPERFDLVACNPPYVDPADALAPEVRDHEPKVALFPPGEPLSVYRRLAPQAHRSLKRGGWLIVEVGQGQADAVEEVLRRDGFGVESVVTDLQGIPRMITARSSGLAGGDRFDR